LLDLHPHAPEGTLDGAGGEKWGNIFRYGRKNSATTPSARGQGTIRGDTQSIVYPIAVARVLEEQDIRFGPRGDRISAPLFIGYLRCLNGMKSLQATVRLATQIP
jgi:hypothetical protein